MRNKLITIIFILIFLYPFYASGQKLVNSPYARFNLGLLEPAGSFRSMGMGGIGISLRDNNSIYFSNPASYSSIDTNSFVFDFGLDYSFNLLSEGDSRFFSDDMNFDHLMMGFPLTKRWGVATGIVPISNGYYKISENVLEGDPGYDPITGEYTSYHAGEGGLTSLFLGTGLNITRNFSLGVNMTILFGQITRNNQYIFADYYHAYHNNNTERIHLSGINFDYGVQYAATIKKNYFFNAGASFTSEKYYKSNYENLSIRYTAYSTNDTLSYTADSTKDLLPGTLRFGISFGKKNKFTAGIDYITSSWSKAIIHGSEGYLANTKSILFGVEIIPDKYSNYSFMKRIEYRLGGHIEDNYLIINGEQIKEFGMSFGLGIPMPRSLSKTNLFFDFTRKSGSATNLHTENYFTMGVSLNLFDFWFLKHKFD
jgi:hypothetical protein